MSAFHETIKRIFAEVDKFLNSTLKDENLSKTSQKERTKILDSLQKLYEEYEVLNPNIEEGSSNSSKGLSLDESRFTTSSTHSHGSEEDSAVDNIPYTTVKALNDGLSKPIKMGYLQKKPTDLLEKFSKQKKYCVIHNNIMYWFKKPGDKKHQGAIYLTGYEFNDLTQGDKEFIFEMKSNKKSYQFQADSQEDLENWRAAIETGSKFVEQIQEDIVEEWESGEEYEPIDDVVQAVRRQQAASNSSQSSASSPAVKSLPPLPTTPRQPLPPPEEEFPQEAYAEGFSMAAEIENKKKQITSATMPPTNVAINTPNTDDFEDDNLIYEFVEETPPPPSKNKNVSGQALPSSGEGAGSSVPDVPPPRPPPVQASTGSSEEPPPLPSRVVNAPQPPLPPLPQSPISACTPPKPLPPPPSEATPPTPKVISPNLDIDVKAGGDLSLEEDFENLFYGAFTCVGDTNNELSFDRGDVIHVLNRDLDLDNWWIGESYGKVGLVPKLFLTPMYEILA